MKDKYYFEKVDLRINFPSKEKEILEYWKKKDILKKYLVKNKNSKKKFSFLDGPITANNPMGVHHAWGRTYKDLWQRYKNMRGFKQRFQNGFDAQGLWVEVEVEKELGFRNKKEIKKYGVEKFVDKCKSRVKRYADIITKQSKRLGYFMNWDNSYFTLSDDNNYLIWKFLKVCYEKGWLYKGKDSVPWCPRCETAISQHEILTEDYKIISHKSVIIKFPIEGRDKEYLLVWTTTPWTIPANIAIAVDKNIDYALIDQDGKKYWLAKDAIKGVFGKDIKPKKVIKGKNLVGLKYRGPFDNIELVRKTAKENLDTFHTVVPTDERIMPITTDEGTGLVHTAVSAGVEDYKLGQKLGLPMIPVIDDRAVYFKGLGFLSGKNAKKNPELILDYLEKGENNKGETWVFSIFKYKHRYPVCWRCKEELVWKVTDEWYIAMDEPMRGVPGNKETLRQQMKKVAKKIHWIPKFGLKRELDWLKNMGDWLISKKNRYWGLALPIWECPKCGNFEVMGSKEELKEKAVEGWGKFEGKSPHKPQIDQIKIECPRCGNLMSRIEPVGNPWLDAGIVPFSTISKNNKAAQFTPTNTKPLYLENKKLWREWYPADFITESFPGQFKNWFYALIAMSTVLENEEPFKTVLGFATLLSENGEPMHKSSGDMIEFSEGADKIGADVMRWMYLKHDPKENLLFGFKLADETRRKFHLKIWNIYNFFVTYANNDNWKPDKKIEIKDIKHKRNILDKWVVSRMNQTIAFVEKRLDDYDAFNASMAIEEFVDDFSNWYIRRSRERVGAGSYKEEKQEFYEITYWVMTTLSKILAPFTPFISEMIYRNLTKEESVHLTKWPDRFGVDKKLLDEMTEIRNIVEKAHSLRKEIGIPVRQPLNSLQVNNEKKRPNKELLNLLLDELNVKKIVWIESKKDSMDFDTKLTPALKEEAKTRELIRAIQMERKKAGLRMGEEASVISSWLPKNIKLLNWLKEKTYTSEIKKGKELKVN